VQHMPVHHPMIIACPLPPCAGHCWRWRCARCSSTHSQSSSRCVPLFHHAVHVHCHAAALMSRHTHLHMHTHTRAHTRTPTPTPTPTPTHTHIHTPTHPTLCRCRQRTGRPMWQRSRPTSSGSSHPRTCSWCATCNRSMFLCIGHTAKYLCRSKVCFPK